MSERTDKLAAAVTGILKVNSDLKVENADLKQKLAAAPTDQSGTITEDETAIDKATTDLEAGTAAA